MLLETRNTLNEYSTTSSLNDDQNTGRFNDLEFMLTHLNHVPRMTDFRDYVKHADIKHA